MTEKLDKVWSAAEASYSHKYPEKSKKDYTPEKSYTMPESPPKPEKTDGKH